MKEFPVRIYAADVRPLEDGRLFAAAYERVTEDRRKKVDRIKSPAGQRLSLAAELLLLYGLSQLENPEGGSRTGQPLSFPAPSLRYRYGKNGKPYLENFGVRDALSGSDAGAESVLADSSGTEIYFNLSHSAEMAVCAIAPCEVGCDIEKIKESFLKVTGEGLRLGLDSFQIIPEAEKISVPFMSPQTYYFREYEAAEGYCCAACAVRDNFEPQIRRTDIRELFLPSATSGIVNLMS